MTLFKTKSLQGAKDTLIAGERPAEMSAYISTYKSTNLKEVIMKTFNMNRTRCTKKFFRQHLRFVASTFTFILSMLLTASVFATTVTIVDGVSIKERGDVKVIIDNPNNTAGIPTPGIDAQNRRQNETSMAISPVDPKIIAVGANDYRLDDAGDVWFGLYVSDDEGKTWFNTMHPGFPGDTTAEGAASGLLGLDATADPVVRFDSAGNLFLNAIALNRDGSVRLVYIVKYDYTPGEPGGISTPTSAANPPNFTYAFTTTIAADLDLVDKPWMAIDTNPESLCLGNIYVGVSEGFFPNEERILSFRSLDGGLSFDTGQAISEPQFFRSQLDVHPAIAPNGDLYASYQVVNVFNLVFNSDDPFSDLAEHRVVKSEDCGDTYSDPIVMAEEPMIVNFPNLILGLFLDGLTYRAPPFSDLAVDDTDPDTVYFVYSATGSSTLDFSDQDIFMLRTTDGGDNWSLPVRVNDDTTVKHQYFPSLDVKNGVVHVGWIDHRDSPEPLDPLNEDVANYYYAVTNIGDVTFPDFSTNIKISDVGTNLNCLNNKAGLNTFQGDYTELAVRLKGNPNNSGNGLKHIVHVSWMDNRDVPDDRCLFKTDQEAFDEDGIPLTPSDGRKNTNIYVDRLTVKQVSVPTEEAGWLD